MKSKVSGEQNNLLLTISVLIEMGVDVTVKRARHMSSRGPASTPSNIGSLVTEASSAPGATVEAC